MLTQHLPPVHPAGRLSQQQRRPGPGPGRRSVHWWRSLFRGLATCPAC